MARTPKVSKKLTKAEGRFSYEGLDRVIHEKARLGILASLVAHNDGLLFNDLKQLCSLTDGNLNPYHLLDCETDGELKEVRFDG